MNYRHKEDLIKKIGVDFTEYYIEQLEGICELEETRGIRLMKDYELAKELMYRYGIDIQHQAVSDQWHRLRNEIIEHENNIFKK